MFLLHPTTPGAPADLVFSASDLVAASECEYRTLRILDEKLGRSPKADFPPDEMQARAGKLGDLHEHKVLASLIDEHGPWDPARGTGVYCVERGTTDRADLANKARETAAALRTGADVVFQATFFDGEFLGYADFLVREGAASPGSDVPGGDSGAPRYAVWDTKLARHAKVGALLQLAAYGDQLISLGLEPAPRVTLVLGNMERSSHSLADLLPVYRERRARFRDLTAAHRHAEAQVAWQQPGVTYCGRCDYCAEQVTQHRDLLMVAGMTSVQRKKLVADGITTIDALADLPLHLATGPRRRLRDQARMQTGREVEDGSRTFVKEGRPHTVTYKVLPDNALAGIPAPSDGDIFFDFEGDPLWQDPADRWGLEYLFGVIEAPRPTDPPGQEPLFRPFWAHSRADERQAFLDFLAYVEERRARYPDMHVYHYAPYEKTALRNLSLNHVAGEDVVDSWLRGGLLVDLYATVRHSLRISEASYSIKKLEPLYMGDNLRSGDVKDAGASVVAYAAYCEARDAGPETQEEAAAILASISDYNQYDCLSTLRLRDWLLQLRGGGAPAAQPDISALTEISALAEISAPAEAGALEASGSQTPSDAVPDAEPSQEEAGLRAFLDAIPEHRGLTPDEQAVALVAAATGYHRRERKQFWWGHFDRLESEVDRWRDQRNVFIVESAEVVSDWAPPTARARTESRTLRLTGIMSEGSEFKPGSTWFRMFEDPLPDGLGEVDGGRTPRRVAAGQPAGAAEARQEATMPPSRDGIFGTLVEAVEDHPDQPGRTVITITEKSKKAVPPYFQLPMALTDDRPIPTVSIEAALAELAQLVGSSLPELPKHPGVDILRRTAPRLAGIRNLPAVGNDAEGKADYVSAITRALEHLDGSYVAVQGPPGTGKTFVGSHVIARLVQAGWKVGVVAQSHAVVENMLCTAIEKAGVDHAVVAKKLSQPHDVPWTCVADEDIARLLDADGGCLVGGTAWTMTSKCVPARSLDLLVIDEAGQYSLANTLAVARSAKRLLLLGDPQQLPQVTQGSHPEPVDESALGWLSAGHATMPAERGYFLADSWRMHPELCRKVSVLSYDGKLESAPAASLRHLDGLPPGVETVLVPHAGNTTSSAEEAAAIVGLAREHIGLKWTPGKDEPIRRLEARDILVVAAYNAQVQAVRQALDHEGLSEVRVGTVDKFQGQEAPVVLVSMACSAIAEAPRGAEFLLNRNRINVAVSRGQWRAVIVRSPELTNYMPSRPFALEELGAFLGLSPGQTQLTT
ncbi:TM0106 family RecB-like putative nuclease [Arthrobacter sp. FW305-BF8]|uniref:TM0106 family RecB-like putative nuclease n=1 Tax=Arthrobacter sp. FW305-BF8 TaxID=2879617 RepID=UPI001F294BCD|nr:TM0106 family RecB-like putative nuclease [Arthrobacter sp. FW305-BF8]UKA55407.1 TM0106 family RecB-like putative nuclease [Arthrobacter sp. FW305-BF8]